VRAAPALLLALVLAPAAARAHEAAPPAGDAAEPPLAYALPEAGSYALPPIQRVGEHALLDSDGAPARLPALAPGQLAVIAFVYLGCHDAQGCPLALATLARLDRALAAQPELARRVRVAAVSFDPARDRPESLARLRRSLAPRADWRFLTAADPAAIAPVLADYGQEVDVLPADAPGEAPALAHVLKVFLVDSRGDVRNVYSTGFLDHRLVVRDVETLLLEGGRRP
jgi:cytochrome oxidase Cu insertion factor (SCO1/SenC/PrrC family)